MSALSLALGRPKLDTGLEIQFQEFQIERRNHFTGHTSYILNNAAECAVGLFDCRSALLLLCTLFNVSTRTQLFFSANPLTNQSVSKCPAPWGYSLQVPDFIFAFVELRVPVSQFFQPIKIHLKDSLALQHVSLLHSFICELPSILLLLSQYLSLSLHMQL